MDFILGHVVITSCVKHPDLRVRGVFPLEPGISVLGGTSEVTFNYIANGQLPSQNLLACTARSSASPEGSQLAGGGREEERNREREGRWKPRTGRKESH